MSDRVFRWCCIDPLRAPGFLESGPLTATHAARNSLLAKHSVDPGNIEFAFLRLNDNVVALLETIEVILIDGDMFKGPAISPGSDDEAAAARERARGNFSDDGCGNADGARSVQLSVQEKKARVNPRDG